MQNIATKLTAVVALGQALQLEADLKSSGIVQLQLTGVDGSKKQYDVPRRMSFADSPWNTYDYSKGFEFKVIDPDYEVEIFNTDDFTGTAYIFPGEVGMNWMPMSAIYMNNYVPSLRYGPSPLIPQEDVKTTIFSSSNCDYDQDYIEFKENVVAEFQGMGWMHQVKSLIVAPGIVTAISDSSENTEIFEGSPNTQFLCQEPALWSGEAQRVEVRAPLQSPGSQPVMEVYKDVNCTAQAVVSYFEGANEDGEVIVGYGDLGPVWDNGAKGVKLTPGLAVSLYQNHLWGQQQDIGPSTDADECIPVTIPAVSSWKMTLPGIN